MAILRRNFLPTSFLYSHPTDVYAASPTAPTAQYRAFSLTPSAADVLNTLRRQSSFAYFSAQDPTRQIPGTDLDAEFNAVKVAIDDTQQNLGKIQDDDGALARGSVGREQLGASILLGFSAPHTWQPGTIYTADTSTVFNANKFYIATVTHTSGVSFEPDNWEMLADFTTSAIIDDGSISTAKLADNAVQTAQSPRG
ncbi:hypothetical protein IVB46_09565 [Bradyrhizobium sp. 61]|uniref:hypothetical protein n=1 Tax=Bradyrhizobium sp. 61 TaxID=2782679 RepID=UPI001FFBB806|nr:hypothetical protein [Bradyrhizobium sp. 61]MCK1275476.1 hypothetical protein [Bradyrhizobium sp. 61]